MTNKNARKFSSYDEYKDEVGEEEKERVYKMFNDLVHLPDNTSSFVLSDMIEAAMDIVTMTEEWVAEKGIPPHDSEELALARAYSKYMSKIGVRCMMDMDSKGLLKHDERFVSTQNMAKEAHPTLVKENPLFFMNKQSNKH